MADWASPVSSIAVAAGAAAAAVAAGAVAPASSVVPFVAHGMAPGIAGVQGGKLGSHPASPGAAHHTTSSRMAINVGSAGDKRVRPNSTVPYSCARPAIGDIWPGIMAPARPAQPTHSTSERAAGRLMSSEPKQPGIAI